MAEENTAAELLDKIAPLKNIDGDMIRGLLGFVHGSDRLPDHFWCRAEEEGWRAPDDAVWDPVLERSSVVGKLLYEEIVLLAVQQLHPSVSPEVLVETQETRPSEGPVRGWVRVAEALGISEDTVSRRRKERGDKHPASFPSTEAVWEWWRGLHDVPAPAPPPSPTPSAPRRQKAGPRKTRDVNADPMDIVREIERSRKG